MVWKPKILMKNQLKLFSECVLHFFIAYLSFVFFLSESGDLVHILRGFVYNFGLFEGLERLELMIVFLETFGV